MKPEKNKRYTSYLQEPKIRVWKDTVLKAGCKIYSVKPLNLYYKPNGELLFALLSVNAEAPDGNKLPSIIFIRGHASIVVPLVINRDTEVKQYLMVKQRRIASGEICLEFPAGMLDTNIYNPVNVAMTELFEETGISLPEKELFPLSDSLLYSSPGASDEGIYYFGCRIILSNSEFQSLEGQIHGNLSENEKIILTLKSREEAEAQLTSLQACLGFYLFEEYYKKSNEK